MIFDDIELWGEVTEFAVNPPIIVLEVFDQDAGVSLLFLLCIIVPISNQNLDLLYINIGYLILSSRIFQEISLESPLYFLFKALSHF